MTGEIIMKKYLSFITVILLFSVLLMACSNEENPNEDNKASNDTEEQKNLGKDDTSIDEENDYLFKKMIEINGTINSPLAGDNDIDSRKELQSRFKDKKTINILLLGILGGYAAKTDFVST